MPIDTPPRSSLPEPSGTRGRILLTSYLAGLLKYAGPVFAPRAAAEFLAVAGADREVFLPFFYRWFDEHQWAQEQALRLMKASLAQDRFHPPHVFHAPFAGRRLWSRSYYRDVADPNRLQENQEAFQRECVFLGSVRREFGIREQMLYILHLGRRQGRRASEALRVSLEAVRPALEVARSHGVVLALENVADRSGSEEHVGARLPELEDALGMLSDGAGPDAPIGWTFDASHALLAYRGDAEAISRDLQRLLPSLVHIHMNAPRFYPSEHPWADRHEAPTEGFRPLWDLFHLALTSTRFRAFGGITYEVNWAAPFLNPLLGGSNLASVVQGYALVRRVVAEAYGALDEYAAAPYTTLRDAEVNAPAVAAGSERGG